MSRSEGIHDPGCRCPVSASSQLPGQVAAECLSDRLLCHLPHSLPFHLLLIRVDVGLYAQVEVAARLFRDRRDQQAKGSVGIHGISDRREGMLLGSLDVRPEVLKCLFVRCRLGVVECPVS